MTPVKWLLLTTGSGAIIAYAVWWYRTREEPVRGRAWAAGLRAAALATAWLIFLNPSLPVGLSEGPDPDAVLLDASFSMSRPLGPAAPSVWSAAGDSLAGHEGVWLFGGSVPRHVRLDSLPAQPLYGESRLAPALRAAASAGARRAIVVTDGAIADAVESLEEAHARGMSLSLVDLSPSYPEIGIADLNASAWVLAGDTAYVRAEIVAAGVEIDSVRVEVEDANGRIRAATSAPVPQAGRYTAVRLSFPIRDRAGFQRFLVRLSSDTPDPEQRDDRRAFYVRVSERPAGPVLISLRPDWEPSFLIPVLDRLTDAPTSAYLLLADSLVSLDGYRPVPLSTVQRRAHSAPLLVLHGFGAGAPDWARSLARDAARLLVLPAGRRGFALPGWSVRVGPPASGEWYASEELPGSPLALELSGIRFDELPPLLDVRAILADRAWAPLTVQRSRRGEPVSAVLVGRAGGRRWAVGAADGYWRWAFRSGPGRQLYRALWTGVAGWLLAGRTSANLGLEPRQRVVSRGGALRWVSPPAADSLSLELSAEGGDVVWRGLAATGDSLAAALPPGRYRYLARAYREGRLAAAAEGPVEVEEFSPELLPSPATSFPWMADSVAAAAELTRRQGFRRGLATLGWPYLILIALFCAEWAVRRFSGLR